LFTGHQNGYVRSSSAAAIAEAAEHWQQTTKPTLDALQQFYREKVGTNDLRCDKFLISYSGQDSCTRIR
jgi:hypothetical protein